MFTSSQEGAPVGAPCSGEGLEGVGQGRQQGPGLLAGDQGLAVASGQAPGLAG